MILELADFRIDDTADFEAAMHDLASVIASADGYLGHTVERSIESPGRYLLMVRWESVEHLQGFRDSEAFVLWRQRLGSHRDGAVVEHLENVLTHGRGAIG